MSRTSRRPVVTREGDRVTMFEIFFDLVFVFALTRVVSFMEDAPGAAAVVQGLLLLVLLWWAWTAFNWLGNRVRLDSGYIQVGMLIAMAGLFVAALVIPQAWTPASEAEVSPALVLALAFTVVRLSYIGMFIAVSRDDPHLRTQLSLDVIPQSAASVLLIVGACQGGTQQTILWACAFCADFGGGRIASQYSGWRLVSAGHFVERHGLMLIIAIGETLVSAGTSSAHSAPSPPLLIGALLGLAIAGGLWWLYFAELSSAAERVLIETSSAQRAALARDGYTFGHFPLVAGVVYVALGVKMLLDDIARDPSHPELLLPTAALCGGIALYLVGLELVRRVLLRAWRRLPMAVAAGLLLIIVPTSHGNTAFFPLTLGAATLIVAGAASARAATGDRAAQSPRG